MSLNKIIFGLVIACSLHAFADEFPADITTATNHWDELLKKHVRNNGGVDYVGLDQDFAKLEAVLQAYKSVQLASLSTSAKKALYINVYNAGMMYNLLRYAHEQKIDLKSGDFTALKIKDISIPGGNIWSGSYRIALGGMPLTLDEIEHGLLRGAHKGDWSKFAVDSPDPRIHVAVNCAAISCPRVRETAYRPATVEKMLDENLAEFLSSGRQFRKLTDKRMLANSIVLWYYDDFDDFGKKTGSKKGAGDYLSTFIRSGTAEHDWKVEHLCENFNDRSKLALRLSPSFDFSYDWRVNDIRNKPEQ